MYHKWGFNAFQTNFILKKKNKTKQRTSNTFRFSAESNLILPIIKSTSVAQQYTLDRMLVGFNKGNGVLEKKNHHRYNNSVI